MNGDRDRGTENRQDDPEDVMTDLKPWWTVVDTFYVIIDKFLSIRLRVVAGSRQECMYQLMELGIPQQGFQQMSDID